MTPEEVEIALDKIEEIHRLKKEKNAIILGHNYMTPEVYHGVSDIVGDSLLLAREASCVDADIILFNGVYFMAETAKILNPDKKVLIADVDAGCSLVDRFTANDLVEMKKEHPGVPVVTYVNSSAAVKAHTDVCCTSANALQVVQSLDSDTVIMVPDRFLAANVAEKTSKKIITHPRGSCIIHEEFQPVDVEKVREQFGDDVLVIAHPECSTEVTHLADFTGSTSQMEKVIAESDKSKIFLVTECSMTKNLQSIFPDRDFMGACKFCPYMKLITLDKVLLSLREEIHEVSIPEDVRVMAIRSVERMLEIV